MVAFAGYTLYSKPADSLQQDITNGNNQETNTQVITNLRLGICNFDTMNPILSKNKTVQFYSKLIFEPLLEVNQDYSLEPCLATEYSKTGDTSYIIKLRKNVKWQDGEEFTAKDVKYTIDRLKEGIDSIYTYNLTAISGLEVIDDYTIKINLFEETPYFEYNLIFPIMPANYYTGVNFADDPLTPIGTGKYSIEKIDENYIKLTKNDKWWNSDKKPKIDSITINKYSNVGEIYNAFKIGNIDLVVTENTNFEDYIGTIGFNNKIFKGRQYDFLAINMSNNVLAKKEVRQAINYGIDRKNIVASVLNDKYYVSNGAFDFGSWLFNDANVLPEYSTENAQKVLTDNEWTINSRQWRKYENYRTLRTNFSLVVNSANSQRVAVAENIKEQLANIGIVINIRKVNDWQYNSYLENKNYDLILTGTNVSISPSLNTYFGENNMANYNNEDVTRLLGETKNITDKTMLKDKLSEVQKITNEDVVYIPLYINKNVLLYSTGLVGEVNPNWYNIFYNIENWYRQN